MKKKKIVKEKKEDLYKVSVKMMGKFFTSTGVTLDGALGKIEIRNPRGVSVWRVEHNGKIIEKILQPFITTNIFRTHGTLREVALKKFSLLFGNL